MLILTVILVALTMVLLAVASVLVVADPMSKRAQKEPDENDIDECPCEQSEPLPCEPEPYWGLAIVDAETLPGWQWEEYDDGSGHLRAPDGKSYFGYDLSTHEYRHPGIKGNNWRFFHGYPDEPESFLVFKQRAELWIKGNIIATAGGCASVTDNPVCGSE